MLAAAKFTIDNIYAKKEMFGKCYATTKYLIINYWCRTQLRDENN